MEGITSLFNEKAIFTLAFYIVTLVILIHVVIFAYHWYSFGADQRRSVIGIMVHIIGTICLLGALAISLWYI